MKLAYNPSDKPALTGVSSDNKDIIFDLSGIAIYARGVKFDGKTPTVFKKHTSANTGGYDGLVPAPSYADSATRFLREDGTWVIPDKTTSIHWDNIDGKPNVFNPSQHIHTTNDILSLINYTKATELKALTTSDTLNVALGKLEYKSDLGVTAYNWYKSITDEDTDEHINKWNEIVSFLNGVTDTTLNGILNNFVNDLEVTGSGNAVTNVSKSNNKITVTKGNSFLPLSGGTLSSGAVALSIVRTGEYSNTPCISYIDNTTILGSIGIETGKGAFYWDYNTTHYLIHSGNIGSQSVASASNINNTSPILVSANESDEIKGIVYPSVTTTTGLNNNYAAIHNGLDFRWYNSHWLIANNRSGDVQSNGFGFWYSDSANTYTMKAMISNDGIIYSSGGFSGELHGNAVSATKLQTARSIWGQSFDGTGNVDGLLTLNYNNSLRATGIEVISTNGGEASIGFNLNSSTRAVVGCWGNALNLWRADCGTCMTIPQSGNVGIGTTSPQAKLDVNGDINAKCVTIGTQGLGYVTRNTLILNPPLHTGGPFYIKNRDTNYNAYLDTTYGGTTLLTLIHNGNFGIGTSDPLQKLHVNGGLIRVDCSSRYVYLGTQNSSHAHYETNADVSHWFNKRVEVNGHVNPYTTNSFSSGTSDKRWANVYSYNLDLAGVSLSYGSSALAVTTGSGTSYFGMMNSGYCHIYTEGPSFYMNKPLYVDNGNYVIHSGNIGSQSVNYANSAGNASSATTAGYATNSTYLYASDSPYRYGDSAPYYMRMRYNVNGDNRWYLSVYPETPKYVAVDHSYSSDNSYRASYLSGHSSSPDNSHPGHGARIFYSWNIGAVGNATSGYSNGITIGSHPSDTAYGFQIVQNMWDDRTYTRRYNGGWQSWKTLAWTSDIPSSLPANGGNADTTDGVHIEWAGSQAASSTTWLTGWTSDGTKLKAIKQADLSVNYAASAGTATSLGSGALMYMCSLHATGTFSAYKITTNWNKSLNIMPTINIRGYAYGTVKTIDCDIVMYHYDNVACSYSLTNKGSYPIRVWQAIENNVLVFYINPGEYYGMFNVFVYSGMGTNNFTGWSMTTASAVSGTEISLQPIATSITGNADTVNGYHIAVQSSAGTNASTIYFVI